MGSHVLSQAPEKTKEERDDEQKIHQCISSTEPAKALSVLELEFGLLNIAFLAMQRKAIIHA